MNKDESRRRSLEKRTSKSKKSISKTSESTQTGCQDTNFLIGSLSENLVKISPKKSLLANVFFIWICSLSIAAMCGWHFSAFVNEKNNHHSLEKVKVQMSECRNQNDYLLGEFRKKDQFYDLTLKEKSTEEKDLKGQLNECRNQNHHLKDEKRMLEKQFDDSKQILNEFNDMKGQLNECRNQNHHLKDEKRMFEKQFDDNKQILNGFKDVKKQIQDCRNSNDNLVEERNKIVHHYENEIHSSNEKMSECRERIEHLLEEKVFYDSTTKTENMFCKIVVLILNSAFPAFLVMVLRDEIVTNINWNKFPWERRQNPGNTLSEFIILVTCWCLFTILFNFFNTTVEISPIFSCSILIFLSMAMKLCDKF